MFFLPSTLKHAYNIPIFTIKILASLKRFISVESQRLLLPLPTVDLEIQSIIAQETERLRKTIVLIASENFTSRAVLQALGPLMTNKYSEGYPGARYYGGNEFIDMAENLCRHRALAAYRLNPEE